MARRHANPNAPAPKPPAPNAPAPNAPAPNASRHTHPTRRLLRKTATIGGPHPAASGKRLLSRGPAAAAGPVLLAATHAAAQLDDFVAPDIPPLPEPSLHERLLFEMPLTSAIGIAVIAIITAIVLAGRSGARNATVTLVIGLAAGAGLYALGTAVQTRREALLDRTRELVDATARADLDRLEPLLTPNATIEVPQVPRVGTIDADVILDPGYLESQLEQRQGVDTYGIRELQATIDGPNVARSQVAVWILPRTGNRTGTWWLIDWQQGPDGAWRARRIESLWIQGWGSS